MDDAIPEAPKSSLAREPTGVPTIKRKVDSGGIPCGLRVRRYAENIKLHTSQPSGSPPSIRRQVIGDLSQLGRSRQNISPRANGTSKQVLGLDKEKEVAIK